MYKSFKDEYHSKNTITVSNKSSEHALNQIKELSKSSFNLIKKFGGQSFEGGLYRIHTFETSLKWMNIVEQSFPAYFGKIVCFGFDWMGCQYCEDKEDANLIYLFDVASYDVFELEQNVEGFHNYDLIKFKNETLQEIKFKTILKTLEIGEIGFDECLGYNKPLFLGGEDNSNNYEKTNMEVYWELQVQIYNQIKDLPDDSDIGNIKI